MLSLPRCVTVIYTGCPLITPLHMPTQCFAKMREDCVCCSASTWHEESETSLRTSSGAKCLFAPAMARNLVWGRLVSPPSPTPPNHSHCASLNPMQMHDRLQCCSALSINPHSHPSSASRKERPKTSPSLSSWPPWLPFSFQKQKCYHCVEIIEWFSASQHVRP